MKYFFGKEICDELYGDIEYDSNASLCAIVDQYTYVKWGTKEGSHDILGISISIEIPGIQVVSWDPEKKEKSYRFLPVDDPNFEIANAERMGTKMEITILASSQISNLIIDEREPEYRIELTQGSHKFIYGYTKDGKKFVISEKVQYHKDIAASHPEIARVIGGGWLNFDHENKIIEFGGKSGTYGETDTWLVTKWLKNKFDDFQIES
jgi:hypothetical protein